MRTSAWGSAPAFPLAAVVSVSGASPFGHGISVKRDSRWPWKSERRCSFGALGIEGDYLFLQVFWCGLGLAASARAKVETGAGVEIGSKLAIMFNLSVATLILELLEA